jgi:hypothetical protein
MEHPPRCGEGVRGWTLIEQSSGNSMDICPGKVAPAVIGLYAKRKGYTKR